jgi:co-chaperonin GroES (HSP10)
MEVLESKLLIKPKRGDEAVEKIGKFEVPVGAGEYEVAEVISIGPKVEGGIKVGDTVYYYPNAGKELTISGQKYRVITSSEVLVVL